MFQSLLHMEIIHLPFNSPTLLLLPILILFLIKAWKKSKLQKLEYPNLPPSPPKLPIIGHLHHFMGGGLPHQTLDKLTGKYGRTLHLYLGEVLTIVISSREAIKEVFKDQDPICAGRPGSLCFKILLYNYANISFSPYNERWRQMRKICVLELLSAKNVRSFGHIMRDEVAHLVESIRLSSGKSINLTHKLLQTLSFIICRAAFGKDVKGREALLPLMRKGFTMAGGFELADLFPSSKLLNLLSWNRYRLLWIRSKLDSILDDIVKQHRQKERGEYGGEDIVDALLRIQKNEELFKTSITMDNVKAIIFDMFSGGTETTTTTIDWAMAELMRNPRVKTKAQVEIRKAFEGKKSIEERDVEGLKYLKLVIKETFRLHPVSTLIPRETIDDCTVDGYSIPAKCKVVVNLWTLGRDPEYWQQPETFWPERFENSSIDFLGNNCEFIPFGVGRRICPGINFGLANVELILAELLYHFDWKMPDGMVPGDIDMTENGGIATSRKNNLNLIPIECNVASY